MREFKIFSVFTGIFLLAYFLPLSNPKVQSAILEAFRMLQWYARNHTLACVVPALFIAGAITTFLSREAVLRHLGPKARKAEAYSVASVSGTVLAVCSCSVLPMFTGIYRIGAGLGPAAAFLYSGPALNILAIFLTARVLGFQLGLWRAVGAIVLRHHPRRDHGRHLPKRREEPGGGGSSATGSSQAETHDVANGRLLRRHDAVSGLQRLV